MRLLAFLLRVHNNKAREVHQNIANELEKVVNTYLVRIADRDTGQGLRILVRSHSADGMQEFVDTIADHPHWTQLCGEDGAVLATPRVIDVRELKIKRPVPRTTMASFVA